MRRMRNNKIHPKTDHTCDCHCVASFIQKTFHRRECIRFYEAERINNNDESIENSTPDGNADNLPRAESICACGHIKSVHSKKALGAAPSYSTSKSWTVEKDTALSDTATDAYGKIEFDETEEYRPFNKPTVKRFIRLDYEVDLDKVLELFDDKWKMDQTQLFLSVISNETRRKKDPLETDEMRKRREAVEKFCEKLVEAATQTNAWIITEGVMEGIGGIVGDKIEKIVDEKGKRPIAVLSICNWGCIRDKHCLLNNYTGSSSIKTHSICNTSDGKVAANEVSLDRNHSAFVLVDDGRQFQPGCERSVRQNLELKLRKYKWKNKDENSIPFIYFLIGGNASDIENVKRALDEKIPVIIAKGTGGAADLIAEVVNTSEEVRTEKIAVILGIPKDSNDAVGIRCNLESIREKETLLQLFDTNEEKDCSQDLSLRILDALKVSMNKPTNVFLLAAEWDNKVFFKGLLRERPDGSDLEDVMYNLLLKGNHSYVEVLLGKGVNLVEVAKNIGALKESENQDNKSQQCPDGNKNETVRRLIEQLTSKDHACKCKVDDKITKLLCLWSVYKGMPDMAKVFWREGKNYLAMALMAYKISKDEKKKLRGTEERSAMREQMKVFATLSTSFLLNCDTDNRTNTIALLQGKVCDLNGQTPMQIAFDADFKEFVAQPSFQELLKQIWSKPIIDHSKHKYLPLSVGIVCPFAAPALFEYDDEDTYPKCFDEHSKDMGPKSNRRVSLIEQPQQHPSTHERIRKLFLHFFWKVGGFLDAPITKFIYHALTYLAYLVLFSIVMLTDFRTTMSPSEIALTIWTFILIVEECRQVAIFRREYLSKWNVLDVLALTLYVIGFILRIIHQSLPSTCPECLYVARIILAFSLLIAILRVLQLLSINRVLGPKIYMIGRLIRDMISFMLIITIFIAAYGVASNAILYPNQPLDQKLLVDVFYDSWWSVLQQFNREDALGLNCNLDDPSPDVSLEYCSSPTDLGIDYEMCKKQKCPANTWLVSVLLAFYALLTCIMMLNVLIAMFNVSFTKVEEKENRVSRMQRYRLIREYTYRSMLPAPLCVFSYWEYIYKLCKPDCISQLESAKNMFGKPLTDKITIWEERMREKYDEEIRIRQLSEIATMVPSGNEFGLVLNSPNYVNTLMQSFMTQVDKRLSVYVGNHPARRDNEESNANAKTGGEVNATQQNSWIHAGTEASKYASPATEEQRNEAEEDSAGGVRKYSHDQFDCKPKLSAGGHSKTQRDERLRVNTNYTNYISPPESSVHDPMPSPAPANQRYKTNSQQDTSKDPRSTCKLNTKRERKLKSVKAYPGRYRRPKPILCSSPACKMIVRCRNGTTVEFEQPFLKPVDWSKIPAKKALIARVHFKCENCEKTGRVVTDSAPWFLERDNLINLDTQFDLKAELTPETHSETQIHVDESVNSTPSPEWPRKDRMPSSTSTDESDETNSQQDTSIDTKIKIRKRKSVKTYPGRCRRPKPKCTNPYCKMIVTCRSGRSIEFKQPFSKPMDLSKLPLRKAQIARIHFKCENCETAWRVMKSESSIREVFDSIISPE